MNFEAQFIADFKRLVYCYKKSSETFTYSNALPAPTINIENLGPEEVSNPVQQDVLYQQCFFDILDYGLIYHYQKRSGHKDPKMHQTLNDIDRKPPTVVIIGAGPAGLSAARELLLTGYDVKILEASKRVGGRVRTSREMTVGLHAEKGAMRLPGPNDNTDRTLYHYLTDYYIKKYKIEVCPFINSNNKAFLYINGTKSIRKDTQDSGFWNKSFPGWNFDPNGNLRTDVKNPSDYFQKVIDLIVWELGNVQEASTQRKSEGKHPNNCWENWFERWYSFSCMDVLSGRYPKDWNPPDLEKYLPWTPAGISALRVGTYLPLLHLSIAFVVREFAGHWWVDPMHVPKHGMDQIWEEFLLFNNTNAWPNTATINHMNKITFGRFVTGITRSNKNTYKIYSNSEGMVVEEPYEADYVLVTIPPNAIRTIQFSPPLPAEINAALSNIYVTASTKILLQFKTRFWECDYERAGTVFKGVGEPNQEKKLGEGYCTTGGGWTQTDELIGQIHYPEVGFQSPNQDRGIIVSYTWEQEALTWNSMAEEQRIRSALMQLSKVHGPKVFEEYEIGIVQAWYQDPYALGAFCGWLPHQEKQAKHAFWDNKVPGLFFASDSFSTSSGWQQGAIESALFAVCDIHKDFMERGKK